MKRLSFRQKLLLTYVAFALTLIFVTFSSVGYYINTLQKKNVTDAIALAEEQAQKMAFAAEQLLSTQGSEALKDPDIQTNLRTMTQINLSMNETILWAAVISPDGDRVVEEFGHQGRDYKLERDENKVTASEVPLPQGGNLLVQVTAKPAETTEISMPIPMEGNKNAQIKLRVMKSPTFKQIEASSQRITRVLVGGSVLMLAFLLGIFLILWRMFFRHLELQENNAKLDRMAYVGTLASGLAHEIRNPLSSMNVNLEVIREELDELDSETAARTSELSQRVQREVQQLNGTLTSFLDFALPRKEGYSQFPLRGLVEELLEAHDEELKSRQIAVEIDSPAGQATIIEADRRLMHQAIRNILVNAIQVLSNSVKKTIRITIKPLPKDRIRISIADSGPGIKAENMAKIFEVFFSTRKGGSGFGLAIARKIVEEHEGTLAAVNNVDSLGTTFTMELPCFAPQEHQERMAATGGALRFWGGSSRAKEERI